MSFITTSLFLLVGESKSCETFFEASSSKVKRPSSATRSRDWIFFKDAARFEKLLLPARAQGVTDLKLATNLSGALLTGRELQDRSKIWNRNELLNIQQSLGWNDFAERSVSVSADEDWVLCFSDHKRSYFYAVWRRVVGSL